MKNIKFKLGAYLYNLMVVLLFASLVTTITVEVIAFCGIAAFFTGTLLSFCKMPSFSLFEGIQLQVWQKHIEDEIFKDNSFLRRSYNADSHVIDSKVVHIPQSGGSGNVVKNRTVKPAAHRERTDTDVIYLLDEYTTDPVLIPNADTHELSYNKRDSVIGEDVNKLNQVVAEETLLNWVGTPAYGTYAASSIPAERILVTSGDNIGATAQGATGTRKGATTADVQKVKTRFMRENYWFNNKMWGLLTPDMEAELFPPNDIVTQTAMANVTDQERKMGVMYVLQGFKLMTRSSVYRLMASGAILAPEALGSVDDDEASIFWYEKSVEFAFGGVEAFQDLRNPLYYGDLYSFLARSGGRARRADFEGIYLLKQGKVN